GTGMCGACRVTVGGETRFACVEGPEFDGHKVDFDELITRLSYYRPEERTSLDHHCRMVEAADAADRQAQGGNR
ncbi:MAG TPA: sulfide/dihydroorotate dehydrogenase-like FAD/NAD-binding protein, partial [Candidatus Krumholzibacteria bacterium]|nr:sulfide/dihydroorotate dehydrogenase-like FAD/NAD-binding protein [Candidatus Krumholzibacteria bacterium]